MSSEEIKDPTLPVDDEQEDWNVDEVKGDHESDEHWELRRNFLLKNKGNFPKLRLLSLSQVFANHEFLGCRYPEETMQLVAELSVGIVEEYRTARKGRLQRTFVKASDAAERKSKGTKRASSSSSTPQATPKFPAKVFLRESSPSLLLSHSTATTVSDLGQVSGEEKLEAALSQYGDDLKGFVLVEEAFQKEGFLQTINRSCGMSHKPLSVEYSTVENCGMIICIIKIGNFFIKEGRGWSKDAAKKEAASRTLEVLRQLCYTIEIKASVVSATEFGKKDIHTGDIDREQSSSSNVLTDKNVGNKLLRLMGWQDGKGLGKEGQGIQAPISAEVVQRSRLGFGSSSCASKVNFRKEAKQFLERQIWQCREFDLKFSPEFSSDERSVIHQVAGQLGLRSRSLGKGNKRFLVVSRKVEMAQLVQELLMLGDNAESAKYRVVQPRMLLSATPSNNSAPISSNNDIGNS